MTKIAHLHGVNDTAQSDSPVSVTKAEIETILENSSNKYQVQYVEFNMFFMNLVTLSLLLVQTCLSIQYYSVLPVGRSRSSRVQNLYRREGKGRRCLLVLGDRVASIPYRVSFSGANQPILQIVLVQNGQVGKELQLFCSLQRRPLPSLLYKSFF